MIPDAFGRELASGDFDRDGYADLAIGVPGDWVGSQNEGAVNVMYGSAAGLTAAGDQYWTKTALSGPGHDLNGIGGALAAADFDGDGFRDLAIASQDRTAVATILYGSPGGLTIVGATVLATESSFGWDAFAAGDLDGDGFSDLAAASPGATVGDSEYAGAVSVYYGSADGLSADGSQVWTQDSPGIADEAETHDWYGSSLAIGDFDTDGFGDLAIGVPREDTSAVDDGAVAILYGSGAGLIAEGNRLFHQDVPGIPASGHPEDGFGSSLATGHLNGGGAEDLAIGVPGANGNAGAVTVLYGGGAGLSATGAQRWTQNRAGVPGTMEAGDRFGLSLASANYGRSGRDDLAVGVPDEKLGRLYGAGVVNVLYGRASGLSGINAQGWSQNTSGVRGTAEDGDAFGGSFAP